MKEYMVLDALSRKHQFKMVYVGERKLQKEIQLTSHCNGLAKEIKQNTKKGIKSHFHFRNRLLWYKQNWLYVPKGRFRDVLLKECHDGPLVGHGGAKHTITFLKKSYYWPNLKNNAKEYVKIYSSCQKNQIFNKKTNRIVTNS
jgi:hypothetical protein